VRRTYIVLLRAIAHTPMEPFRRGMEELGYANVESFGMSGNLTFDAAGADAPVETRYIASLLERRIAERFGTDAFVRTPAEMARVVTAHPFGGAAGASVMFLARAPSAARRQALISLEFDGPTPLLRGRSIHFVHPATARGTRGPLDFERLLGVRGTARSMGVVHRLTVRLTARGAPR
jgi:hypothetical protein